MAPRAEGAPRRARTLAAFQADLARRLAQAESAPQRPGWLALSWRGVQALLPLTDAAEVLRPPPQAALPHARPWAHGVAAWRGGVVVPIDWVEALGVPAADGARAAPTPAYWVVLAPAAGVPVALEVDRLPGLRAAPLTPAAAPPPWGQAWRDAAGDLWPVLDAHVLRARIDAVGMYQSAWVPQRRMDHV